MSEVRRFNVNLWEHGYHSKRSVVLATDYDALRAQAVRLRAALMARSTAIELKAREGCTCPECNLLRETADLEDGGVPTADYERGMSGPDGPVADSCDGYKIMPGEEDK